MFKVYEVSRGLNYNNVKGKIRYSKTENKGANCMFQNF